MVCAKVRRLKIILLQNSEGILRSLAGGRKVTDITYLCISCSVIGTDFDS